MTPQEAAEQYANEHWGDNYITENKAHDEKAFIAGQQWQFEVVSSALKEIAKLHAWKNEMLQLWNKLDAYIETRKDIRPGESKVDFAIKIMKERDELHAKVKELQEDIEHNAKRAIEIAKERDELNADVKRMESIIGELKKENNQMKFGLQLIIGFDDSSIYSDPGEIAQEYLPKKYQ